MEENSISTANISAEAKKQKVIKWLVQEGYSIIESQDPKALWIVTGKVNGGIPIVVANHKNVPDRIDIQAGIIFDGGLRKQILEMNAAEREEFLWELRFGLLNIGVEFVGLTEMPEDVGMTKRVYDDGLTKDVFIQRMVQVKRASHFVRLVLARRFKQTEPEQISSFIH